LLLSSPFGAIKLLLNLVGSLGDQNLQFSIVLKSAGKNKIQIEEIREFFDKRFSTKSILVIDVTLKQITVEFRYMKFISLN